MQQGPLGGDCTFTGCVPSKAVIEAAARGASFREAMAAASRAVEVVAAAEDDGVLGGRTSRSCTAGRRSGPGVVDVDGTVLHPTKIVLSAGGRPAVPPIPGLDGLDYLTNENVFDLETPPQRLAVLSGGAIGCELTQAFGRLGVGVTIIEGLDRLLPREEPEASAVIGEVFGREGIEVRTGKPVERLEPLDRKGGACLHLSGGETTRRTGSWWPSGARVRSTGWGSRRPGIAVERGFVVTDDTLATTAKDVWAVGDVAGKLQFTHAADEMGRIAAGNALSRLPKRRFRAEWVPWVTFTDPEVARVGVSEADVAGRGRVAYLPMSEVDRALAAGATEGFVKLVAGPRRLLT